MVQDLAFYNIPGGTTGFLKGAMVKPTEILWPNLEQDVKYLETIIVLAKN